MKVDSCLGRKVSPVLTSLTVPSFIVHLQLNLGTISFTRVCFVRVVKLQRRRVINYIKGQS